MRPQIDTLTPTSASDHSDLQGLDALDTLTPEQFAANQTALGLLVHEMSLAARGLDSRATVAELRVMLDARDYSAPWLQADLTVCIPLALARTYRTVALHWASQGWACIPADLSKRPLVAFADYMSGATELTEAQILAWAVQYPWATPLFLPASNPSCPMVVVDGDHRDTFGWITDTFGLTSLTVTTGRAEGGRHYYYRLPSGFRINQSNGEIGPEGHIQWDYTVDPDTGKVNKGSKWGRTKVDVKSGLYVVSAGATHRSGLPYGVMGQAADFLPTKGWIEANVPLFDVGAFKDSKAEHAARKEAHRNIIEKAASPARETHLEALRTLNPDLSPELESTILDGSAEPFLSWCESDPEEVNLHTWYGMAATLAAVHGAKGREEFHRLSGLSQTYRSGECEQTWGRALRDVQNGKNPPGYRWLRAEGYMGPIPAGHSSPASYLKAMASGSPVAAPAEGLVFEGLEESATPAAPVGPTKTGDVLHAGLAHFAPRIAAEVQAKEDLRQAYLASLQAPKMAQFLPEGSVWAKLGILSLAGMPLTSDDAALLDTDPDLQEAVKGLIARPTAPDFDLSAQKARVAKRQAKASGLTEADHAKAEEVCRLGLSWAKDVRAHLRAQGLNHRGSGCATGRTDALINVVSLRTAIWSHGCNRLSCVTCGPTLIARKGAAVALAFEGKPVYQFELPTTRILAFLARWSRIVGCKKNGSVNDGSYSCIDPSLTDRPKYVIWRPTQGPVVVWTDLLGAIPLTAGNGQRNRVDYQTIPAGDAVLDAAKALLLRTYAYAEVDEDEGMIDLDGPANPTTEAPKKVTGTITSSRGLGLNPDKLTRDPQWALLQAHVRPVEKSAIILEAAGLGLAKPRKNSDETADRWIESSEAVPLDRLAPLASRLALEPQVEPIIQAADPMLDDELEALLSDIVVPFPTPTSVADAPVTEVSEAPLAKVIPMPQTTQTTPRTILSPAQKANPRVIQEGPLAGFDRSVFDLVYDIYLPLSEKVDTINGAPIAVSSKALLFAEIHRIHGFLTERMAAGAQAG